MPVLTWYKAVTKAVAGFVTDIALLSTSPSLRENSQKLSADLQAALDWGSKEGITFDPAKSELLHFSRRPTDQDPSTTPAADHLMVSESTDRPYLRWLGVLFDKKLTFKWHTIDKATKALNIARALRSHGNTVRVTARASRG